MTCCFPSQTTALFPALSDRHPLQLHLSSTFCIISVSMFPSFLIYAGQTGMFHQSSRKEGSMARIKVATSGLNWPQSTLLITHYRVTNLPLSVTVVCSVEILIARINYFILPAPFILLQSLFELFRIGHLNFLADFKLSSCASFPPVTSMLVAPTYDVIIVQLCPPKWFLMLPIKICYDCSRLTMQFLIVNPRWESSWPWCTFWHDWQGSLKYLCKHAW